MYRILAVSFLVVMIGALQAYAASFDCKKAEMPIEKTICSDESLSALDDELANAYARALVVANNQEALKREQRAWVKKQRNSGANVKELSSIYLNRIAELNKDALGRNERERVSGDEEPLADWLAVCKRYQAVQVPAGDIASSKVAASLSQCNSYRLYYGIDQGRDPVRARLCAYDEMSKGRGEGPFGGRGMLMVVYANGVGAKRNWPLAIKFACGVDGAPMEIEGRVDHLETLRKADWQGTDFSLCDDITSGYMQGFCAQHAENLRKPKRALALRKLLAAWTAAKKNDYVLLRQAADKYFRACVDNEVEQLGSASNAFEIEEQEGLEDEFLRILQDIDRAKVRPSSAKEFQIADAKLNKIYKEVQQEIAARGWGSLSKNGVQATQRTWLKYRDAWVAFCAKNYGAVSADSVSLRLTNLRTKKLKKLVDG